MTSLTRLIDFFATERFGTAADQVNRANERGLLHALLTSRPAEPIPSDILTELERLLAQERDARGTVDAAVLPTLADEGRSVPGIPADRVALWRGDLTRLRADAIVNAANAQMLGCFTPGHACIDNAIHRIAGPRLRAACAEHMQTQGQLEPTGHATVTDGFLLPAAAVIHTVGPIVHGELDDLGRARLARSYRSVLDAAHRIGAETVGLCSVSTGVFGFPKPDAAIICLAAIADWYAAHPSSKMRVVISLFADVDATAYNAAIAARGSA